MPLFLLLISFLLASTTAAIACSVLLQNGRDPFSFLATFWIAFTGSIIFLLTLLGLSDFLNATAILISQTFLLIFLITVVIVVKFRGISSLKLLAIRLSNHTKELLDCSKTFLKSVFSNYLTALLFSTIAIAVFSYLIVAALTPPMNYDSNTYRLTKIAYWLQEGNIFSFQTHDPRHNYTGLNFDLLMLWIMSFSHSGYAYVKLVSFFSGLVVCFCTWEISKTLGANVKYRLIAIIALLAMTNVTTQFITTQTDLITTSYFSVGLIWLIQSAILKKPHLLVSCGTAMGIGIGGKGTILYLGPALVVLLLSLHIGSRWQLGKIFPYYFLALTSLIICCATPYIKNYVTYGNLFAPASELQSVGQSSDSLIRATTQNAQAYIWQLFEPGSNPKFIHPFTQPIFEFFSKTFLDEKNSELFQSIKPHVSNAKRWVYDKKITSEDGSSSGVISMLFIAIGAASLFFTRSYKYKYINFFLLLVILISFVFFCLTQQFTPFKYRYFILVAPIIAAIGTLGVSNFLSNRYVTILGIILVFTVGFNTYQVVTNPINGIQTVKGREFSSNGSMFNHYSNVMETLPPDEQSVGVAITRFDWSTPFLRQSKHYKVTFIPPGNLEIDLLEMFEKESIDILVTNRDSFNSADSNSAFTIRDFSNTKAFIRQDHTP